MNTKIVAVALMMFMSLAVALTPFAIVIGQNNLGVSIIQVVPASQANSLIQQPSVYNGSAGELFNIKGTIYTSNGTFNIIVGNTIVASGTSEGYYVNINFTVPQLPGGDYNFLIEDVKQGNLNSTGSTPEQFLITKGYTINPANTYNQEGSIVALTAEVTGGSPGLSYSANVTVVLPSPLNGNFSQEVTMVANSLGTATAQLNFPSSNFQSGDSLQLGGLSPTDFAGNYTLFFNMTEVLGENQFTVGFLDMVTYHRGQTATVAAQGYSAGQTGTLSVTNDATGSSLTSEPVNADASGEISTTFVVPTSAAVGSYSVAITTTSGTAKLMQDSQAFYVPGYSVTITTLNLDGRTVPNILVGVKDQYANTSYNSTSNSKGVASFNLEAGPYQLTAYWLGIQNIGQTSITVTGPGSFDFECELTNLQITVLNENGTTLPFVNLAISYVYGSSQTENVSAQTDSSGTCILNSTLSGVSYTIQASLYGQVFNAGNETIDNLPAQAIYQFVIVCPTEPITINVVGYNNAPISGANIQLVELTNGLFYSATTDSSGSVTAPLTFGFYKLQIYQNGILLNQTTINATLAGQYNIRCTLYGIQVSVSVVDYFGQPISNANVTLNGPAAERFSAMTNAGGKTTFNDVIGGSLQVIAFAKGTESSYQALSLTVYQPTSVQIKMDGYVAFGALLIPTNALMTLILLIVAIVILVIVEIFLRRRRLNASEN